MAGGWAQRGQGAGGGVTAPRSLACAGPWEGHVLTHPSLHPENGGDDSPYLMDCFED